MATSSASLLLLLGAALLFNGVCAQQLKFNLPFFQSQDPSFILKNAANETFTNVPATKCSSIAAEAADKMLAFSFVITEAANKLGTCIITSARASDGACQQNPCKHTGVCQPGGGDQFTCDCPYPLGGATCEDLVCVDCYRKDDLVIFVNTSLGSVTWQQSRDHCQAQGMTLFLDKDPKAHDFVKETLAGRPTDADENVAYWIGVSRMSSDDQFTYVDGTPVQDSYAPWAAGRPSSSNCVNMAGGDKFAWNWDDDGCGGASGWSYYNLCQQRYPFLLK